NLDENSFLRNCYVTFYDPKKEGSWEAYERLKERYPISRNGVPNDETVQEIFDFLEFLQRSALFMVYLNRDRYFMNEHAGLDLNHEIDRQLKYIRCHHVNASVMPLFLAIMDRLSEPRTVSLLLETLEKVNFRMYVLPRIQRRADSKQGELFRLA